MISSDARLFILFLLASIEEFDWNASLFFPREWRPEITLHGPYCWIRRSSEIYRVFFTWLFVDPYPPWAVLFFFLNHYANLSFSSPQRLLLFYVFSAIDKAAIVSFVWVVVAFVAFQSIDCQQVTYEEMHAHTHTHTHTLTHTHRHTQTQAPWGSPVAIGQRRAMTSRRVGDVSRQTSSKATTRFQKINK